MFQLAGKMLFMNQNDPVLIDAGVFIGALLQGDSRHEEAFPLVKSARDGDLPACTTLGILSEVYAALTWKGAIPQHSPTEASMAVKLLIEPPSEILLLSGSVEVGIKMLELAEKHQLIARRIHDARHAALAISAGIHSVYTYDNEDWKRFEPFLTITGPNSVILKKS